LARPEGLNYTIIIKLVVYKNGQCYYKLLLFIALQIIVYILAGTDNIGKSKEKYKI